MIRFFYPQKREESAFTMDYDALAKDGIKGIIFDIDNTLVPHGAPATENVTELFHQIHARGISTCVLSNNGRERVEPFAMAIDSFFIFNAGKPLTKAYEKAMALMQTDTGDTVCVGDQLLTDIFGANRMQLHSILVNPIDTAGEPPTIRFKRRIERFILRHYQKELEKQGKLR